MSEAASLATVATPLEIMPDQQKEMLAVVQQNSLAPETAASLQASFLPLFQTAKGILERSKGINVTDPSQKLDIQLASTLRKALKANRIAADKLREELKRESLRRGNAIQGFYAILIDMTGAEEARLEAQEKIAERMEAERKTALKAARELALAPYKIDTSCYLLADMTEETFTVLLTNTKASHEMTQAAIVRAQEEKLAAENARLLEQKRIREENEKLKREAEEREAAALLERQKAEAAAAQARAQMEAAEAAAAKAAAEAETLLAKERAAAAEAQRVADENARLAREAAEKEAARIKAEADAKLAEERRQAEAAAAKLKAEADAKLAEERRLAQVEADRIRAEAVAAAEEQLRLSNEKAAKEHARITEERRIADEAAAKERERVAEEARVAAAKAQIAKDLADALAKKEREAREQVEAQLKAQEAKAKEIESARLAEIEAERVAKEKAASAPDKDRLLTFANAIRAIELPEFSTDTAKSLAKVVESQRGKFLTWIEEKAGGL